MVDDISTYATSAYLINPDLTNVNGVPTKYWNISGDSLTVMTTGEIAALETNIAIEDMISEIHRLHGLAWQYIYNWYDEGGLLQLTDWKHTYSNDTNVQNVIGAVELWKTAVMNEYLFVKKQAVQTQQPYDEDYIFIGGPPASFTDVFLTIPDNSAYRPDGWSVPDVSGYTPGTR